MGIINNSYNKRPEPFDTHEPSINKPDHPYSAPFCFPKERMKLFDNSSIFGLMDLDTLFFIFYHQSGSYQQFMAAKQLKIRGWSFNKKYSAWFQRHFVSNNANKSNNVDVNDQSVKSLQGKGQHIIVDNKYEFGTYIFFDRNKSWQIRMRDNFKFDYKFLEDDNSVNVDDKIDWNKLSIYGNGCGLIYGEQKQQMLQQKNKNRF